MKVSFFVHNLSENPIVRTYPIAKTFEAMGWETEVLGFLFDERGVYQPYKNSFTYKTLTIKPTVASCLKHMTELSRRAEGDVIYACKPLITSFLPALKASHKDNRKPLLLDVEDNDVEAFKPRAFIRYIKAVKNIKSPGGYYVNHWLLKYVEECAGVTVSSSHLQSIYGGEILLHGPPFSDAPVSIGSDEQLYMRKNLSLPSEKILLLFAGKSRSHKGIRKAVDALSHLEISNIHLVLAGDPRQPDFRYAKEKMGDEVTLLGEFNQDQMRYVNQACDIGLILQDENEYTKSQIPAKLLECFAYGRPVVATSVGDLPNLLGSNGKNEGSRGWLVRASFDTGFRLALSAIEDDYLSGCNDLKEKALRAHRFHLDNASIAANRKILSSFPEVYKLQPFVGDE